MATTPRAPRPHGRHQTLSACRIRKPSLTSAHDGPFPAGCARSRHASLYGRLHWQLAGCSPVARAIDTHTHTHPAAAGLRDSITSQLVCVPLELCQDGTKSTSASGEITLPVVRAINPVAHRLQRCTVIHACPLGLSACSRSTMHGMYLARVQCTWTFRPDGEGPVNGEWWVTDRPRTSSVDPCILLTIVFVMQTVL